MEYINYIFIWGALTGLFILLSIALVEKDDNLGKYLLYTYFSISIGIPMLYWVLKITFNLLMIWYFILAVTSVFLE